CSANVFIRARVTTTGFSNCDANRPDAIASFLVGGLGQANGWLSVVAGAETSGGSFIGYPNDGLETEIATTQTSMSLGTPFMFYLEINARADVLDCDFPPASISTGDATVEVFLPLGGPVFNLPPGITANSQQLRIVNNRWLGPPCPADINNDG